MTTMTAYTSMNLPLHSLLELITIPTMKLQRRKNLKRDGESPERITMMQTLSKRKLMQKRKRKRLVVYNKKNSRRCQRPILGLMRMIGWILQIKTKMMVMW